jgi:hypothetical protein
MGGKVVKVGTIIFARCERLLVIGGDGGAPLPDISATV